MWSEPENKHKHKEMQATITMTREVLPDGFTQHFLHLSSPSGFKDTILLDSTRVALTLTNDISISNISHEKYRSLTLKNIKSSNGKDVTAVWLKALKMKVTTMVPHGLAINGPVQVVQVGPGRAAVVQVKSTIAAPIAAPVQQVRNATQQPPGVAPVTLDAIFHLLLQQQQQIAALKDNEEKILLELQELKQSLRQEKATPEEQSPIEKASPSESTEDSD